MTDFSAFWALYPRRVARAYAEKIWNRLPETDRQAALKALPAHVRQWARERRELQHVPHASSWLNQRRWEDELETRKVVIASGPAPRPIDAGGAVASPVVNAEEGRRQVAQLKAVAAGLVRPLPYDPKARQA